MARPWLTSRPSLLNSPSNDCVMRVFVVLSRLQRPSLTPGALSKLTAINLRNASPRFRALPNFQLRRYTFHRCYNRRRIVSNPFYIRKKIIKRSQARQRTNKRRNLTMEMYSVSLFCCMHFFNFYLHTAKKLRCFDILVDTRK